MEILQSTTINNVTITVEDSWNIAPNVNINLKELFSIDGQVYMAYTVDGHQFTVNGRDKDTKEITYTLNRNRVIELAEHFILQNNHLFS